MIRCTLLYPAFIPRAGGEAGSRGLQRISPVLNPRRCSVPSPAAGSPRLRIAVAGAVAVAAGAWDESHVDLLSARHEEVGCERDSPYSWIPQFICVHEQDVFQNYFEALSRGLGVSSLGLSFTNPEKSLQTYTLRIPHPLSHPRSSKAQRIRQLHVLQIVLRGYPPLNQS